MIIQKTLTMKEALEEIAKSIVANHLPEGFDHSEIVCNFNSDNTFTITVMDKEEIRKLN